VTSPYLIDEAKKLKLGQDRIKTGAKADHRARDFRFSRNQREAGIEHLEWEHRLPPPCRSLWLAALIAFACPPDMLMRLRRTTLRPWMFFAIAAVCWGVLAVAIAWMMAAL
jgi:hypothetical protein